MVFKYDGTYEEIYQHINQMIIDGNVMNMYLIIMEEKMVLFILMILHVMVSILSGFIHIHIPVKHT